MQTNQLTVAQIRQYLADSEKPDEWWAVESGLDYWKVRRLRSGETKDPPTSTYQAISAAIARDRKGR